MNYENNFLWKNRVKYYSGEINSTRLWRYMPFEQFMYILEQKKLWFSRLSEFKDEYEGTFKLEHFYKYYVIKKVDNNDFPFMTNDYDEAKHILLPEEIRQNVFKSIRHSLDNSFANCWTIKDMDSDVMWYAFGKGNNSIAIITSYSSLIDTFAKCQELWNFEIRPIEYIDYKDFLINDNDGYIPLFRKRKRYTDENELRIIVSQFDDKRMEHNEFVDEELNQKLPGLYISIDIYNLIERVAINPDADSWFKDLVECICKKNKLLCCSGDNIG